MKLWPRASSNCYSYDPLGNVIAVQYPFAQWANGAIVTAGPQYNYTYDAMNRIAAMTGRSNRTLVSSASYNPANQILQLEVSPIARSKHK